MIMEHCSNQFSLSSCQSKPHLQVQLLKDFAKKKGMLQLFFASTTGIGLGQGGQQVFAQFPYFASSFDATGTSNYLRLRVEGRNSVSGTPGSPNMVYELTFFNPGLTGGVPWIELLVGQQARGTTGAFSAICSTNAVLTGGDLGPSNQGVSPNQSYVLVGDATGTSWTVNTGYYVGNSGY
jgi:hypothetical protein